MKPPSYTSRRDLLNRFVGIGAAGFGLVGAAGLPFADGTETVFFVRLSLRAVGAIDGDTLRLEDGRELRLTGIEAPKAALAPHDAALGKLAAVARDALAAIGTGAVIARFDTLKRDRYGRMLAQVYGAGGLWLQQAQVAAGFARVHGDGRNRRGLRQLLAAEEQARRQGLGIWRHPLFAVRDAQDPSLSRQAGSFQIVAGEVAATAVVRDAGYINFGSDRLSDLTLVLPRGALAMMDGIADPTMIEPAAGDSAAKLAPVPDRAAFDHLAGRRIRCRGWLELHDGPSLEISHPEQIELME